MNKANPLVTVVTTTYKKYDKLYQCIDSVLAQDYEPIEYIISDDGCSDFPKKKIEQYILNNKRNNIVQFSVIRNKLNVGTVRHQKNIYTKAAGTYLVNLAGDDEFYDKNVISRIVNRFLELNCGILCTSRIVYDNNRPICFLPHILERRIIDRMNTPYKQYCALISDEFYDMASGSATAFDKNEYFEIGYESDYKLVEDFPLYVYYTWKNKISFALDIVSVKYHLGGVSNTGNPIVRADMKLFNLRDREAHIDEIDKTTRGKVRFYQLKAQCHNKRELIYICLKYPYQCIDKLIYKISRFIYKFIDRIYIKWLWQGGRNARY